MSVTYGKLGNRRKNSGSPTLLIISILFVISSIAIFVYQLVTFSQFEERIPADIIVAGVNVGGLTPNEAVTKWEQAYDQPIILYYDESPIVLNPNTVGFRINNETLQAQALASGETDGGFWQRFFNHLLGQVSRQNRNIPLIADYQKNLLESYLVDEIATRYDRQPSNGGYDVATLTTFSGTGGRQLNIDRAMIAIDDALQRTDNRIVNLPVDRVNASRPSLDTLEDLIIAYLNLQNFIYDGQTTTASIYILDLITGEEINILGDVAFTAASTMKVPIMIDFFRYLDFTPSQEEAWLMANSLLCSNNASSNLIMQIIGGNNLFAGIQSVTNTAQYLGASNSYLTAPFVLGTAGQEFGSIAAPQTNPNPTVDTGADPFNQTTAEDMGTLFTLIYDCAVHGSGLRVAFPDGQFNQQECQQMLELMSVNNLERLLQAGLPDGARISHKNGWLTDTVGDAGVVISPDGHDYVISVYLWEQADFQNYEKLWPLIEEISRAAWNHFNPEEAMLSRKSNIPVTAQECEGNYLPPNPESVNLNDMDSWKTQ